MLDNFDQAGHNAAENTLILGVSQTDLVNPTGEATPLVEADLAAAAPPFVHATFGGMIAWATNTGLYQTTLANPPGRDVSAFQVLSFRVTQRRGSARNPANTAQDFFVRLTDVANQSGEVQVSSVTTIPFPFERHDHSVHAGGTTNFVDALPDSPALSKNALKTIRLPLAAFKADNALLDLRTVRTLAFVFRQTASGEIAIDDIEFSN